MRTFLVMAVLIALLSWGGQSFATTYDLSPIADTWVYFYLPDNNYGSDSGFATDIQNMNPKGLAYLKFDISSLGGETIQSSTLHLYQWNGVEPYGGGGPTNLYYSSSNSWSENSLTWNTVPATTLSFLDQNPNGGTYVGPSTWNFSWDPSWGNVVTLEMSEGSSGDQVHWWYSKEYEDNRDRRPYLELTTASMTPAGVPEPITIFLLGFSLIGVAGIRRKFRI